MPDDVDGLENTPVWRGGCGVTLASRSGRAVAVSEHDGLHRASEVVVIDPHFDGQKRGDAGRKDCQCLMLPLPESGRDPCILLVEETQSLKGAASIVIARTTILASVRLDGKVPNDEGSAPLRSGSVWIGTSLIGARPEARQAPHD